MTGKAYKQEKLYKNKGASWASLRVRQKHYKPKTRKFGWLAEKEPFMKTRKVNLH